MKNKQIISINENQLKNIIYESVKKLLKESNGNVYTFDCTIGVCSTSPYGDAFTENEISEMKGELENTWQQLRQLIHTLA